MNSKSSILLLAVIGALSLASCSGKNSTCTNCTSGSAKVTLTIYDTPPTGTTVLSFSLPIVGISLTPQSGSPVNLYSPSSVQATEITRLQTDSTLIASAVSVPAGSYTKLNITIAATSGVFINSSSSTITYTLNGSSTTCQPGAVCNLPAGAATTVAVPVSLTLAGNQNQWIGINVNLNNAIVTAGGISVDFTQSNVFTANTTTRTGLPSGAVDTIEDFTGKVTALSNSSITVQNAITGQSLTASVVSGSTQLDLAPSNYTQCGSSNPAVCIVVGSTVSMNAALAADGTLTATEIDGLDLAATDEIEGVIYPTATSGVVGLILLDKTSASGNSVLSTATYGTAFLLKSTSNSITYNVDSGPLTTAPGFSPAGFSGVGSLLAGQVVRAQVSNVSVVNNINQANAVNVLLRWSRISGTVSLISGNVVSLTGIPTYITTLNSGFTLTPQAITYTNNTAFDGVTGVSSLTVGGTAAIRALFLDTGTGAQFAFQTAKVRVP
jgi:hypothetical protein